jgi:pyridoxamine 5'-phosphate oxidase
VTASRFESITGPVDLDFPEYERPTGEPLALLRGWLAGATEQGVREPLAVALATADERGRPSSRIVSLIRVTGTGVVFATHRGSRKAREMAATGWASGLLYWRELGRQVTFAGPVEELSRAESEALWRARPVPLHAMSTASRQSEPLDDVAALRAEAGRLAALDRPLPRPDRYAGYLLRPAELEFWCASSDRLHRRLRYDALPGSPEWSVRRLQP